MQRERVGAQMLIPTIVMALLAAVLIVIAYYRGAAEPAAGVRDGALMAVQILPLLLCSFIAAGMVQVLLPQEVIARTVGAEAGLGGILVGSVAGSLIPGGPYVSLPIAAGMLKAGAGVGTVVAFLSGWSLWAASRLPLEVGIVGWKLAAIRLVSTLIFPPIAGGIAQLLFAGVKL